MIHRGKGLAAILLLAGAVAGAATKVKQEDALEAGQRAYESSEYTRAVQILQEAASKEPQNAEIQLLLTKIYFELQEHDAAITSAEKAVALDPRNVFRAFAGKKNAQGIRDGGATG